MDQIEGYLELLSAEKDVVIRELQRRAEFSAAKVRVCGNYYVVETDAKFSQGDIVGAKTDDEFVPGLGIVTDVYDHVYIVKGLERIESEVCEVFKGELLISHELQEDFLRRVAEDDLSPNEELAVKTVFEGPNSSRRDVEFYSLTLDEFQLRAVRDIVSMDDGGLAIIVGPPGTGKTRVVVEAATFLADSGEKVLITSHTNRAVDTALEKLDHDICVRIGYPDKIAKSVADVTLERKILQHPEGRELEEIDREIRKAVKSRRFKELAELYEERYGLIEVLGREVLEETPVVGATILKSAISYVSEIDFDLVIVDEASQITIPLLLLAMSRGRRYAVLGDHRQLPPVLRSVRNSTKYSAFVFLKRRYPRRVRWLKVHYRSNPQIVNLMKIFYEEPIIPSSKDVKLEIEPVKPPLISPEPAVVFVDVCGVEGRKGRSKVNLAEVKVCKAVVTDFLDAGISPEDVAVITPYRAQSEELKAALSTHGVEVGTVDAFQGREKDLVVFSITATRGVGFAADPNRLNVAISRAKKKLVIVGNSGSALKSKIFERIFRICLSSGGYVKWW